MSVGTWSLRGGLCLALLLVMIGRASADTNVSGLIATDTTWTLTNSPYIVTGNVLVDQGVTLRIQPGVIVKFAAAKSLQIDGTLVARGTATNRIRFTASSGGSYWGYILFTDSSSDVVFDIVTGNYAGGCILEYCIVEYAGGTTVSNNGAMRIINCTPYVNGCIIQLNSARGMYVQLASGSPMRVENSAIEWNNAVTKSDNGGGLYVYAYPGPGPLIRKCRISHNFASDGGGIYAAGYGTVRECIITNNTATGRGGGLHGGLVVTSNVLASNIAGHGGGFGDQWGYPLDFSGNSIVWNQAQTHAAFAPQNGQYRRNTITGNVATGPSPSDTIDGNYQFAGSGALNGNNIFANTATYEIYNTTSQGSPDLNAENNWWGTADSAAIQAKIFDWFDDATKGKVDFTPYLTSPNTAAPISPPANLTLTQVSGGVRLNWSANPETDLAGYRVYWDTDSGYPYANSRDVGNVTSCTITGLSPTTTYYFTVTAYDSGYNAANDDPNTIVNENQTNGNESWFAVEQVASFAPQKPTNVSPAAGATGVSVTPTLASSAFVGTAHQASQWQVRTATGSYSAPAYDSGVDQTHLTNCPIPAGYLAFNTHYYWHVCYRDDRGRWTAWSDETDFFTMAAVTNRPPNTPSNVTPTSGATNVSLTPTLTASAFSDPDGDTHRASQWQVATSPGGYTWSLWDSGECLSLTSIAVPAGTLVNGQRYFWHVHYQDSHGAWSNYSPETSFQTLPPPSAIAIPQGLRAIPGARSVRLMWQPVSDPNLAGYNLYRDLGSGGLFTTKINPAPIINTEYLDDNLSSGTTYWYKITAVAVDGRESAKSAAVSARPGTVKITMPDVRGLAGSTVTLPINLENAHGITGYGMDIQISYNKNILTPVDFHQTALTGAFVFLSNIGIANGQVNFSGISGTGARIVGEGHILDVDFFVAPGTPAWTTTTLVFVEVFLYDVVPSRINVDYSDTARFTVAADYILGDLYGDGIVKSADALIAQRIAVGEVIPTLLQQYAGDVNGDGQIDSADVILILRLAVGLPISGGSGPAPGSGDEAPGKTAARNYLVTTGRVQGTAGQTVAVPVTISDGAGMAGCDLFINYDPAKLTFVSASNGTLTQSKFTLKARNMAGQLRLTASAPTKLPSGGGQLFVVNFRIPAGSKWNQTPLTVTKIKLSGEKGENLAWENTVTVSNGLIYLKTAVAPTWVLMR